MDPKRIKWAARVAHVREVSLRGTADLAFWAGRLAKEGLEPAEVDGRAQVLVVAAAMKYLGAAFAEVSVSVGVRRIGDGAGQGAAGVAAFLLQAFNSSRAFAFCERALFSTPYVHGKATVTASFPAAVELRLAGAVVFRAAMGDAAGRTPRMRGDGGWEGPVFLPSRAGRGEGAGAGAGRLFFAHVHGQTEAYPFDPGLDSVTVRPGASRDAGAGALQALADSGFAATAWELRADATHAKSKTYPRDVLAG